MTSQRDLVRASLEADRHPDVHHRPGRRRYQPGEVERIAVAAVVREALWRVATKLDDPTIEQLVDEAADAAAQVMARVAKGA